MFSFSPLARNNKPTYVLGDELFLRQDLHDILAWRLRLSRGQAKLARPVNERARPREADRDRPRSPQRCRYPHGRGAQSNGRAAIREGAALRRGQARCQRTITQGFSCVDSKGGLSKALRPETVAGQGQSRALNPARVIEYSTRSITRATVSIRFPCTKSKR